MHPITPLDSHPNTVTFKPHNEALCHVSGDAVFWGLLVQHPSPLPPHSLLGSKCHKVNSIRHWGSLWLWLVFGRPNTKPSLTWTILLFQTVLLSTRKLRKWTWNGPINDATVSHRNSVWSIFSQLYNFPLVTIAVCFRSDAYSSQSHWIQVNGFSENSISPCFFFP